MNRDSRRNKPIKPIHPSQKTATRLDAGPRPLSGRQRDHLSHLHAAHVGRPETVLHRTVVGVHRPDPRTHSGKGSEARFRSGSATLLRQREKSRLNRKRINVARVCLNVVLLALFAELVAAVLLSPRLWVKEITVVGNATVPSEQLIKRLAIAPNTNMLQLLVNTSKLRDAIHKEPTVDGVRIAPSSLDGFTITVTERQPFAAVKFDTEPGKWYTLDKKLVPFRVFDAVPEARLPLVSVATRGGTETTKVLKPVLGKVCLAPGLADIGACLSWAKEQGVNFPVEKVTIDNAGKLCLNRVGGMTVLLGPGIDLQEKLGTLSLLLSKRTDLRGSAPTPIAEVNLYAYDAPALVPRMESTGTTSGNAAMP